MLFTIFNILLVVAAVIDVRERRLPNALALVLVGCGVAFLLMSTITILALLRSILFIVVVCVLLVGLEALWRQWRGEMGLGMGDIKLLLALMLISPLSGLLSFVAGLLLLALVCVFTRQRSLPLIPFIVIAWLLFCLF